MSLFKNARADVISNGTTMACAAQPGGPPSLMVFVAEGAADTFLATHMGPDFLAVPMSICDDPIVEGNIPLLCGWVAVGDGVFFISQHDCMLLWITEEDCNEHIELNGLEGGRPHFVSLFERPAAEGSKTIY